MTITHQQMTAARRKARTAYDREFVRRESAVTEANARFADRVYPAQAEATRVVKCYDRQLVRADYEKLIGECFRDHDEYPFQRYVTYLEVLGVEKTGEQFRARCRVISRRQHHPIIMTELRTASNLEGLRSIKPDTYRRQLRAIKKILEV